MIEQFYLPIDGTLTGTTNLDQSGLGSNEEVFFIPQIFRTGTSLSDAV